MSRTAGRCSLGSAASLLYPTKGGPRQSPDRQASYYSEALPLASGQKTRTPTEQGIVGNRKWYPISADVINATRSGWRFGAPALVTGLRLSKSRESERRLGTGVLLAGFPGGLFCNSVAVAGSLRYLSGTSRRTSLAL